MGRASKDIIDKIRDMTIFLNPSDASYSRLANNKVPDKVSWSSKEETELIYIETYNGRTKVELRSPDASCNPYLVYALLIRAGLEGINNRLSLPQEQSDQALHLPGSIKEASKLALNSEFIKAVVPSGIIEEYTRI